MIEKQAQAQARRCITTCPSCHQQGEFIFRGVQRWPAAVAHSMGVAEEHNLWECPNCRTSILETTIDCEDESQ